MSMLIWVNVDENDSNDILEKKSALNWLVAFAIATKHFLRREDDIKYLDLEPLISNINNNYIEKLKESSPCRSQPLPLPIVISSYLYENYQRS